MTSKEELPKEPARMRETEYLPFVNVEVVGAVKAASGAVADRPELNTSCGGYRQKLAEFHVADARTTKATTSGKCMTLTMAEIRLSAFANHRVSKS